MLMYSAYKGIKKAVDKHNDKKSHEDLKNPSASPSPQRDAYRPRRSADGSSRPQYADQMPPRQQYQGTYLTPDQQQEVNMQQNSRRSSSRPSSSSGPRYDNREESPAPPYTDAPQPRMNGQQQYQSRPQQSSNPFDEDPSMYGNAPQQAAPYGNAQQPAPYGDVQQSSPYGHSAPPQRYEG
ncbi:hypothetical protein MMC20_001531 [Loxospora ochrophaea]|nr:hypothetical protein [Loxospora ochrophaea]